MRRLCAAPKFGALVCALTLVVMAVAPSLASARRHSRGCANANVSARRASARAMRAAVVCLVNKQRAARHLPSLHAAKQLNRSAQGWTNTMVAYGIFTHGSNFAARISAAGFIWSTAGENIATGFLTPRQVVNAWMASTGHCQNILNPTFGDVGTGVSASALRGFGTGAGTWTQDFALPMGQRAPSGNWGPANGCPY